MEKPEWKKGVVKSMTSDRSLVMEKAPMAKSAAPLIKSLTIPSQLPFFLLPEKIAHLKMAHLLMEN